MQRFLYLSVGLGLKACPLCFYQRSFVMGTLLVLAMSFRLEGIRSPRACLRASPLVTAGFGVAAFHKYLVCTGKLECPPGLLGLGDGPSQSVLVFVILAVACAAGLWNSRSTWNVRVVSGIVLALFLELLTAWSAVASAPPLPRPPSKPYDPVQQPLDGCRAPYVPIQASGG